ncbi:MAG TPA: ABC transporter permease [Acidimicrobiales bacterium]|nr:ABC transporter permease [Acidimicrobiales bacterium]
MDAIGPRAGREEPNGTPRSRPGGPTGVRASAAARWSALRASARRLGAIARKELIQLRRDRRSLVLMLAMPLVLLVIFGYGVRLEVSGIPAELVGHDSALVRRALRAGGHFIVAARVAPTIAAGRADLTQGRTSVAVVVDAAGAPRAVLVDGSDAFTARSALEYLQSLAAPGATAPVPVEILFNPTLRSADVMVPAEVGMIMLWVGTVATALGVVRERETGTLEQLMMTPVRRLELMAGKLAPYGLVTLFDAVVITVLGALLFAVPLRGSPLALLLAAIFYLVSALAIGLLISSVAQNQRQALQTATFVLLPQILLSGALFPLRAIPWGIRWVSEVSPLTFFTPAARGLFLKGVGLGDIWRDLAVLVGMAVAYTSLAVVTFRRRLD